MGLFAMSHWGKKAKLAEIVKSEREKEANKVILYLCCFYIKCTMYLPMFSVCWKSWEKMNFLHSMDTNSDPNIIVPKKKAK